MKLNWFADIEQEEQKNIFNAAIKKAGSERKLEKYIGIPDSSIHDYKNAKSKTTLLRFRKVLSFLGIQEGSIKYGLVDPKSYKTKGGKATYEKYVRENKFAEIHQKMRQASSKLMTNWHAKVLTENEEGYYQLQYNRFKKISEYKLKTIRGEFVRNSLEKEVADMLFENNISYEYGPFVKAAKARYFPDFKFGKTILECTMWRGNQKAPTLAKKITELENLGNTVKVVIPDRLKNFYKPIEKNVINTVQLKHFLKARVAQTENGF